jgi:hypothetical protein
MAERETRTKLVAPSSGTSGKVQLHLIDIAPAPSFAGLERLHDRMLGVMKVFGGVFVFRGITTADVAALQTKAEVNPSVTHLQAFLATMCVRGDLPNLVEMFAGLHCVSSAVIE